MIKFQLFDTENSYQCHFAEISTFVVSIAHYMRAYFNYQALTYGKDYVLPDDAAFLNVSFVCVCVFVLVVLCGLALFVSLILMLLCRHYHVFFFFSLNK